MRAMNPQRAVTGRTRPRVRHTLAAGTIVGMLVLAGCGLGSTESGGSSDAPTTLTLAVAAPPTKLDPAQATVTYAWFFNLAYDSLIRKNPDGTFSPSLAESWGYVGDGNTEFEITLREGAKFSDGSDVDAEALKANIEHYTDATSIYATYLAGLESVEVTGPLSVSLSFSAPNPNLEDLFSQDYFSGKLISPAALDNPELLVTETQGAGPYVLDSAKSVANDHYTFVPNPEYWDKDAIQYESVVYKVIPNASTGLSAIRTGQADLIKSDYTQVKAAKSADLNVSTAPLLMTGLVLADRAGEVCPAMGDERVRQAINYAINRDAITTALLGDEGSPTDQLAKPGTPEANEEFYEYDVDKAKDLLAEAGYSSGLTIPTLSYQYNGVNTVTQAVADDLKNVGITLELTDVGQDQQAYVKGVASKQYCAFGIAFGNLSTIQLMVPQLVAPTALYNPFQNADDDVQTLIADAAAADADARVEINSELVGRLVELGWFAPVAYAPLVYLSRDTFEGLDVTAQAPVPDPVLFTPKG